MKTRLLITLAVGVAVVVGSGNGFAQEEPGLFFIARSPIKSSQIDNYMAAVKTLNSRIAETGFPFLSLMYRSGSEFSFAIPMRNFGDLDRLNAAFGATAEAIGEPKFGALVNAVESKFESQSISVHLVRPDLSYRPVEPMFRPEYGEPFFLSVTEYFVQPGKIASQHACQRDHQG